MTRLQPVARAAQQEAAVSGNRGAGGRAEPCDVCQSENSGAFLLDRASCQPTASPYSFCRHLCAGLAGFRARVSLLKDVSGKLALTPAGPAAC